MKIITDERCTGYGRPGHPERPERITMTGEKLRAQTELTIEWSQPSAVEDAALLRAHTAEHLARLDEPEDFDADTAFFPKIADRARRGTGCPESRSRGRDGLQPDAPAGPPRHTQAGHGFLLLEQHRHCRPRSPRHRRQARSRV